MGMNSELKCRYEKLCHNNSWNEHSENISNATQYPCAVIKKIKKNVSNKGLLRIFIGRVR